MTPLLETLKQAQEALDRLSKLGNEPYDGNSTGNQIAQLARNNLTTLIAEIEKAEPFGWYHTTIQGEVKFTTKKPSWNETVWPPLYTHPAPATPEVDCAVCTNRGGLYGLSQETNCEHCLWQGHWHKKDLFAAPEPKP